MPMLQFLDIKCKVLHSASSLLALAGKAHQSVSAWTEKRCSRRSVDL